MSQARSKSISTIIIQLYSKPLRATWKVLENAKCTWSSKVFICSICYLTIHLLNVSLKRKNKQHFHDHAANDYSRECKCRWSVKTIRMAYVAHPHKPSIIKNMHPKCLVTCKWWFQFVSSWTATFASRNLEIVNIFTNNGFVVVNQHRFVA